MIKDKHLLNNQTYQTIKTFHLTIDVCVRFAIISLISQTK